MKYYRNLKPQIYEYVGSETIAPLKKFKFAGPHKFIPREF